MFFNTTEVLKSIDVFAFVLPTLREAEANFFNHLPTYFFKLLIYYS